MDNAHATTARLPEQNRIPLKIHLTMRGLTGHIILAMKQVNTDLEVDVFEPEHRGIYMKGTHPGMPHICHGAANFKDSNQVIQGHQLGRLATTLPTETRHKQRVMLTADRMITTNSFQPQFRTEDSQTVSNVHITGFLWIHKLDENEMPPPQAVPTLTLPTPLGYMAPGAQQPLGLNQTVMADIPPMGFPMMSNLHHIPLLPNPDMMPSPMLSQQGMPVPELRDLREKLRGISNPNV